MFTGRSRPRAIPRRTLHPPSVAIVSLTQYFRFLIVGGIVGLITVACREVIGYLLPADTPVFYSLSVVGANGIGTALSFMLNRRFTFNSNVTGWSRFAGFAAISILAMISTWLLSLGIRYGLKLHVLFGDLLAPGVAFAVATLISSLITYPLNASLIFRPPRRSGQP